MIYGKKTITSLLALTLLFTSTESLIAGRDRKNAEKKQKQNIKTARHQKIVAAKNKAGENKSPQSNNFEESDSDNSGTTASSNNADNNTNIPVTANNAPTTAASNSGKQVSHPDGSESDDDGDESSDSDADSDGESVKSCADDSSDTTASRNSTSQSGSGSQSSTQNGGDNTNRDGDNTHHDQQKNTAQNNEKPQLPVITTSLSSKALILGQNLNHPLVAFIACVVGANVYIHKGAAIASNIPFFSKKSKQRVGASLINALGANFMIRLFANRFTRNFVPFYTKDSYPKKDEAANSNHYVPLNGWKFTGAYFAVDLANTYLTDAVLALSKSKKAKNDDKQSSMSTTRIIVEGIKPLINYYAAAKIAQAIS